MLQSIARRCLVCGAIGWLLCGAGLRSSLAGPNEGGVLILHAESSIIYSTDNGGYCGDTLLDVCEGAVVGVPSDPTVTTVFFVLAAFPRDSSPRLGGVTFGINYESDRLALVEAGHCGDEVLNEDDWPQPGSGTAVTWEPARTDHLVEVYWFAAYSRYGASPTSFELMPHPIQGGWFVDDDNPSQIDEIAGYGALGFGMDGYLPCPAGPVPVEEQSWGNVKARFRGDS